MSTITAVLEEKPQEKTEWNRESILKLIMENEGALAQGVIAIYDRQTSDEKTAQETHHDNGRGFTGADAKFLTSIARQVLHRRKEKITPLFTPKQLPWVKKKMRKYANQLLKVAIEKEAQKAKEVNQAQVP